MFRREKIWSVYPISKGCLPELRISGFEQGQTRKRTRSPRAATCPSHSSFQGWQYPSTLSFPPQNLNILLTSHPFYFSYSLQNSQNLMFAEIKKLLPQKGSGIVRESLPGPVPGSHIVSGGNKFPYRGIGSSSAVFATHHV
ncbi:hypothetical protein EVAR_96016_1 [Eumeta japonica]|uniref:Uncharacterized protein n=1 Tax=Eumeta variegata TaxID=151549 RepID=A0A4C1XFM3_EUMVA|nr:hypothetical protein EVAR_96016_1 [Eumeta japonica]